MDADAVLRRWSARTGAYSPGYYAYLGPDETSERVRSVVERFSGPEPAILELGFGAGRHLAHLHAAGYRDLHGVDVNPAALAVLRETYPDLAAAGTFHVAAIEAFLPDRPDGRFDVVFAVETLQHLHPDHLWALEEVVRVAGDVLVTAELEGAAGADGPEVDLVDGDLPLYRRDWGRTFADLGAEPVAVEALKRETLRVFRVDGDAG